MMYVDEKVIETSKINFYFIILIYMHIALAS